MLDDIPFTSVDTNHLTSMDLGEFARELASSFWSIRLADDHKHTSWTVGTGVCYARLLSSMFFTFLVSGLLVDCQLSLKSIYFSRALLCLVKQLLTC